MHSVQSSLIQTEMIETVFLSRVAAPVNSLVMIYIIIPSAFIYICSLVSCSYTSLIKITFLNDTSSWYIAHSFFLHPHYAYTYSISTALQRLSIPWEVPTPIMVVTVSVMWGAIIWWPRPSLKSWTQDYLLAYWYNVFYVYV